ncbi:MAG: 4a-hydroxytetrahydrobiopterin dehydratase [Rubrobacter sp.]
MADVLKGEELREHTNRIPDWEVSDDEVGISRSFAFNDFAGALAFVNRVGELAEQQNHHPDIAFGWGRAEVSLTSHDASGLTERDIELAAKVDQIEERS